MIIGTAYAASADAGDATSIMAGVIAKFIAQIPLWIMAVIVVFISVAAAKYISNVLTSAVHKRIEYSTNHDEMMMLVHKMTMIFIISMGVFIAMKIVGLLDSISWIMTALVAGIGFSIKDILGNFLAGIAVILQDKIHIGDVIKITGELGKVTDIGIRATIIETFDGQQILVPNLDIVTNLVTIFTANENRRVTVDVGVSYGSDITLAKQLMEQVAREHIAGFLPDMPISILVNNMEDSSIKLSLKFWINQHNTSFLDITSDAYQLVKEAFDSNGIDIPFPQRTLHFAGDNTPKIKPVRPVAEPTPAAPVVEPTPAAPVVESTPVQAPMSPVSEVAVPQNPAV